MLPRLLRRLLCLALVCPTFASAQQAPPLCEDQLAQAQAQLTLVQTSRAQGEYVASDAVAALRKMNTQLQTRVQELEKERQAAKTTAETTSAPPSSP